MTGNKKYLTDYHIIVESHVSFDDGEKGRVLGKWTLNADGLPRLKNVLHVEGLKENLMSISQLCDQKLNMKFTKNSCKVLNKSREVVLKGSRSSEIVINWLNHTHVTKFHIMILICGIKS